MRITVEADYKETCTMPNSASDTPLVSLCQCEIESRSAYCESITLTRIDRNPIDEPSEEDSREDRRRGSSYRLKYITFDL